MTINIRDDRRNIIASIEIKDGHVVEDTLKGCFVSDIDQNDDGSACYRLDLDTPMELVESLSNETLLEEIRNRLWF